MKNLIALISLAACCLFSTATFSQTTFTGAISNDWADAGNWDNGLPSSVNNATIPEGMTVICGADIEGVYIANYGYFELNAMIHPTAGTFIHNYGTCQINGGFLYPEAGDECMTGTFTGTGVVNDGTLIIYGELTHLETFTNNNVVFNYGDIYECLGFLNEGTITNFGDIWVCESITFTEYLCQCPGEIINNGVIVNEGYISAGKTGLVNNGSITNNGYISVRTLVQNNGTIDNMLTIDNSSSIVTGDNNLINEGVINNEGLILNCGGNYSGNGSLVGNVLEELNCGSNGEICDGLDNNMDGSVDEVCGCTDPTACNYQDQDGVVVDDGSCSAYFDGSGFPYGDIFYNTEQSENCPNGICSEYWVTFFDNGFGMWGYSPTELIYSFEYSLCLFNDQIQYSDEYGYVGSIISGAITGLILNTEMTFIILPVSDDGCTNISACNYNLFASIDDGTCILPDGCTDSTACNYDATAACDDGSCILPDGCTDSTACNYDATAVCDDGTCILPDGCTDPTACNYNATAVCDDGSCLAPGCTHISACNYDASASCDNGSCEFLTCRGCTGQMACNYNPSASIDDGSCEYVTCAGCTVPSALNYDSTATLDDGSCEFETGQEVDPCPFDLNDDGGIGTSDLLELLGAFGTVCPG